MPDPKAGEHYAYRVTPCSLGVTLYPFVGMPYPLVGRISEESRVGSQIRSAPELVANDGRRRTRAHVHTGGELPGARREARRATRAPLARARGALAREASSSFL